MTNPFKRGAIWGLMVAIAAIALAWTVWIYSERRVGYRRLAEEHEHERAAFEDESRHYGRFAEVFEVKARRDSSLKFPTPVEDTRALREQQAAAARKAKFHEAMSQKYREAARRPWLGVEPDPPSP